MKRRIQRTAALLVSAAAAVSLAGCAGTGEADSSGPVTLEYWTWATNMDEMVDVWNEANPDIQVEVVAAAGPDDMIAKLLAAVRAGNGPDIAAAEYQKLPNLVVSDIAMDISQYADQFADQYTEGTMSLVTIGGGVYGVPQDIGPMIYLYRADLFEEYGLSVPTTWDEYAAAAAALKETAPDAYLGGYPDDGSTLAAYAQPLGAEWWATDGDAWKVGIDEAQTRRVTDFWQPLLEQDLVDTTHFWTPEWSTELNEGTLLSWTAGAWAPGSLMSVAPDTAGDWRIAPMPTWDGESEVGIMGGSSAMVTKNSSHPAEAIEFLTWLNASEAGTTEMIETGGLFPASTIGQAGLAAQPVPALCAGQEDFWEIALDAAQNTAPVTWGPNVQIAFDSWNDGAKRAAAGTGALGEALTRTQAAVVADLENSGFSVE
jgi:multiple sugar transport system substrate-binding protein